MWRFKRQETSVTPPKFVSSILIYTSDFWLSFINWIIDDFCWVLLCICPVYMGSTPFVCTILGNETRVRLKKLDLE